MPGGGKGIGWVKNLQIVNGGQTTATIHHVAVKDRADLGRVQVQAKLSVVSPGSVSEVVPLIARYANSQNKVNEADFSANDDFHVRLQSLSRTVWAPAVHGSQRQTRWFYERARGQYMDEKGRAGTPAKVRDFQAVNPTSQRLFQDGPRQVRETPGTSCPMWSARAARKTLWHSHKKSRPWTPGRTPARGISRS